jgi:hypothetical protein
MTDLVQTCTAAASKGGFADKPIARFARSLFPAFARLAPDAAAKFALKLFLTPPRLKTPKWERFFIDNAATGTLNACGRPFVTYSWGNGVRTIVMCHSWGGRGSQLGNFIKPLVDTGFRVFALSRLMHPRTVNQMANALT